MTEIAIGKPLMVEQVQEVQQEAARWMEAGLSTEPCDRSKAETAVKAAYSAAGFQEPAIIWMDSPLGGCYASAVITELSKGKREQLWGQLGDQLGGQLWGQLWGQLRDQLWDQLGGQLGDQLGFELSPWREAYWIALYTKALQLAHLPESEKLNSLAAACRETGWWWPRQGIAILTDRPSVLKRDVQNRLHCEDGPALLYRDRYALYAWHGTRVPADLIENGWGVEKIFAERNTEIRRCAIEKIGWDTIFRDTDPVATAPDPGNSPFTLDLYDLPPGCEDMFEEPARIMLCTNGSPERDGTRHRFGLVVRAVHDDPITAAAELYDVAPAAYRQLEHRR